MNLLDKILSKPISSKPYRVDEWDVDVFIKKLSAKDGVELQSYVKDGKLEVEKIVALCLVDESGNRICSADQVDKLATKELDVMNRIADECLKYNAMTKDKEADTKKN